MMRQVFLALLAVATLGCQAQSPRPEAAPVPSPAPESGADIEAVQQASEKRFDDLEQRFVLMQEQLIKANQQLEAIAQRTQQQLVALQRVQMLQAAAAQNGADQAPAEGPTTLDQLTELVFRLEQLSAEAAVPEEAIPGDTLGFNIVSTVTHTGQWVILKYDEITGLAWNALDGQWVEVGEPEPLENSDYQVVLSPSRTDVKHYVAARIDRRTGQTWWLKNNRWERFP